MSMYETKENGEIEKQIKEEEEKIKSQIKILLLGMV